LKWCSHGITYGSFFYSFYYALTFFLYMVESCSFKDFAVVWLGILFFWDMIPRQCTTTSRFKEQSFLTLNGQNGPWRIFLNISCNYDKDTMLPQNTGIWLPNEAASYLRVFRHFHPWRQGHTIISQMNIILKFTPSFTFRQYKKKVYAYQC
jgi:hypothetical protein